MTLPHATNNLPSVFSPALLAIARMLLHEMAPGPPPPGNPSGSRAGSSSFGWTDWKGGLPT